MKPYMILYRIESMMSPLDPPFGFPCYAEDTDHAEEQCLNAYPDCDVIWSFVCPEGADPFQHYQDALDDCWGVEVDHEGTD